MNKKGQFYLIAAIIIVIALVSLNSISTNFIFHSKPNTLEEVRGDITRENYKVIEYGIVSQNNAGSSLTALESVFTGKDINYYFSNKLANYNASNILFVYGNKQEITALQYNQGVQGVISLGGAGWTYINNNRVKTKKITQNQIQTAGSTFDVEFDLDGSGKTTKYPVTINDNELFYFIIVSKRGEDIFVDKN